MYDTIVHEEDYKGLTIKIFPDEDPFNPREDWDNLGHMICFHNRYTIGDKHNFTIEEIKELIDSKDVISLPIYLYDHSGLIINTTGFSCPWDSGQIGFIYITKDEIRKEYNVKKITKKLLDRVYKYLEGEVEIFNTYLRGDIYGFVIEDKEGNHIDSCWGFGGYSSNEEKWDVLVEARKMAGFLVGTMERNKKRQELFEENVTQV